MARELHINEIKETQPVLINLTGNEKIQNINVQLLQNSDQLFGTSSIINFWGKISGNELRINDLSINTYNGKFDKKNLKQNISSSGKFLIINGITVGRTKRGSSARLSIHGCPDTAPRPRP